MCIRDRFWGLVAEMVIAEVMVWISVLETAVAGLTGTNVVAVVLLVIFVRFERNVRFW